MNKRQLSAYEQNHLLKHGFDPLQIEVHGNKPVEYITGKADFFDREFSVSQATLIPRIETELLIERVVTFVKHTYKSDQKITIADVGCGSGAIGLTLWLELHSYFPHLQIVLSDISAQALAIATKNLEVLIAEKNRSSFRILTSDLLLDYPDSVEMNVLVANLPYIPTDRISGLDLSVRSYEPLSALDGQDPKGLKLVNNVIKQAEKWIVRPDGIFLEIDEFVQRKDIYQSKYYTINMVNDIFEKTRFCELFLI